MAITIGSNIASLQAQRRLGSATQKLSSIYEKLSSGQRINRASDDAAGLAVALSLNVASRIYTQAIRNGNDGISLLNIGDATAGELSSVVTRIRELSEQSANGTYSSKQRQAIDTEAQALAKEYARIIKTTSFNGIKIFDGSLGNGVRLQLGNGIDGSINASIGGAIGTGSFGGKTTFATETSGSGIGISESATLGDVNGDGILDLVTAGYVSNGVHNQGQATILLGKGDGSFSTKLTFTTDTSASGGSESKAVALGDVNGDGILDIVTAGYASIGGDDQGQAAVLLGKGDGTFGNRLTFTTETSAIGASYTESVTLGDVNGDGILDIVTAGYAQQNGGSYQGQATVLLGRGDGTFGDKHTFATETSGSLGARSKSVTLGDVNGDGILDLVTAGQVYNGSAYQGQATILLGKGDGSFGTKLTFATETSVIASGGSHSVILGDVNGDGILDLVTAGDVVGGYGYQGQASVLLGKGDGSFGSKRTFATETSGSGPAFSKSVILGDVNGDGILDIVTAGQVYSGSSYQGQATVLLGKGDGSFGAKITFATEISGHGNGRSESVTLGDVNGDGALDLVTAGVGDNGSFYQGQSSVLMGSTQDGISPLLTFSLKTKSDARQAMGMLDRTLANLAKQRGTIGASQSRVNIAIQNLQSAKENFSAAESRIRDADIASESSDLVRTQILQQASASVLAQANQQPSLALQLLK